MSKVDTSQDAVEWIASRADEQELDYDTPVADVLRALAAERDALRAQLAQKEKICAAWKNNCQKNAAAMNCAEEAFGQIMPVGIRSGDERGPEPSESGPATANSAASGSQSFPLLSNEFVIG